MDNWLAREGLLAPTLELINNAQTSIHAAIAGPTPDSLLAALIARARAGVKVELLLQHTEGYPPLLSGQREAIKSEGIPYIASTEYELMRKYIVIDGERVLYGAWDFSQTIKPDAWMILEADDAQELITPFLSTARFKYVEELP